MSKLSIVYKKFQNLMFKPVDPGSLALFRICFGVILAFYAFIEANIWPVHYRYGQSNVHFTFALFDYLHLKIVSEDLLLLITKLAGISATWIALGLYYRFALLTFLCSFGYLFLLDKAYFNNHCYLIILLTFLLIFMGANYSLSIDALRQPKLARQQIPFWNIFLLRAQLCIVYFFAVIPKMYPDYLGGRQMSVWLIEQDKLPFLKTFVPMDLAVVFFTYSALCFDLFIGFLLCYKPTRVFAIIIAIPFHLLNGHMFPIGIFPYLMIASLILFIDPDKFKIAWKKIHTFFNRKGHPAGEDRDRAPAPVRAPKVKLTMVLIMLYLLLQILIPLRHFLIPGNVNWTKEGIRFSWMLMANVMNGTLNIVALDASTHKNIPVDLSEDINFEQYIDLVSTPDMIHQYVQFLKNKLQAQGINSPAIYVEGLVSINGRVRRPFIDPNVNLAEKEYKFMHAAEWILPPPEDM